MTMTLRSYGARKGWPLDALRVSVIHRRNVGGSDLIAGMIDPGEVLSPEQHEKLADITRKCPVHCALTGSTKVSMMLRAEEQAKQR